jgi:hypothetical protein
MVRTERDMHHPKSFWRVLASVLLTIALAMAGTASAGAEPAWELRKDADGVRIYSRPVEGWTIHETRGDVHIDAKLASVVAVIDDVPQQVNLSDVVKSALVSRRDSSTRYQYHSVIKMPWPLRDRDIVSEREIRQDPVTLEVTITDTAVPDALPRQEDLIRILKSRSVWTLTPRSGGVDVQMRGLSDPNGSIPSSVINAMSVGTPFKTLKNLRRLALEERYVNASLSFLVEPQ